MTYYFHHAPLLDLDQNLVKELIALDRTALHNQDEKYYDIDPVRAKTLVEETSMPQSYADYYGSNYEKVAVVDTWNIPVELEKAILNQFCDFFSLLSETPVVRLQLVQGTQIPIHIDKHRKVSVIHPLQNHVNTFTKLYDHQWEIVQWQKHYNDLRDPQWPECPTPMEFYSLPMTIQTELLDNQFTHTILSSQNLRGWAENNIVYPDDVTEACRVEIVEHACILNVDKCHSVWLPDYNVSALPRLSLYWKFHHTQFAEVISAYNHYVQSKI